MLDWGLNPGPPTLEAITLPLGYEEAVDSPNLSWNVLVIYFIVDTHIYDLRITNLMTAVQCCLDVNLNTKPHHQLSFELC